MSVSTDEQIPFGYCHCGCGEKTRICTEHRPARGLIKGQPLKYIRNHNLRGKQGPDYLVDGNGCWIWQKTLRSDGYGFAYVPGATPHQQFAHRVYYERYAGAIPDGLVIDHLCEVKACVNPTRLEPVTIGDNVLRGDKTIAGANVRKTHCKNGHPFDAQNTSINSEGARRCKACDRDATRRYEARKVATAVR